MVVDEAGREYVDLLGGIAVNALGHAHPAVVAAVSRQVATLGHVSNLFVAEPPVALAELLLALAGRPGRVFFANSGAEANEAAFKLSRRTGRGPTWSPPQGGFHGRTMGALALTGQPAKADPFRPLPGDVTHVAVRRRRRAGGGGHRRDRDGHPGADPGRERRASSRRPATSPRPGGSPPGTARCWCSTRCRPASAAPATGSPTRPRASSRTWSPWPRGSAAGCRSAPAWPSAPAADLLGPGSHGTTFGGNPVSCAAALAVVATIANEGLLDHVKRVGERLRRGIEALGHPLVAEVRGAGLLLGIVLHRAGRRRGDRPRCARPASWSTRCSRT